MKVRKFSAGIGASALVVSGLALAVAAPASADPSAPASATDIVGVGSDTIEGVVTDLANGKTIDGTLEAGWNAAHPSQKIASFDATGTSTVVLREGHPAVPRPNGSGQGKARLFGASNDPDVNFARSSSTLSTSESAALTQYPFAVDGLKMAVSGLVPSNAPATLTEAQIVEIYKGTYKHWNEIPGNEAGSTAPIHPVIPQSGSGTRSFFESTLKAANGNVAVVYGTQSGDYPGVTETQEHSPTAIENDPNVIGPFSTARAQTLSNPDAISLEGGFSAKRAVYNVVRNADTGAQWVSDIFGPTGYFCSAAAKKIIEANGFAQLASSPSGVCGVPTTAAVANFTTNTVTTATTLAATAPAGRQVKLTATIDAGGQSADGDVEFFEGGASVGTGLLSGGQAVLNLNNVTPGQHTYKATFTSANPASFTDSASADAIVTVKEISSTTATVTPGSYGHAGSVRVTVTSAAGTTGTVTVKVNGATVGTAPVTAGSATFALPVNLTAGNKTLTATYSGNDEVAGSSYTGSFTRAKSGTKTIETFATKINKGKRATGFVKVALNPGSAQKATGSIVIKKGAKVVGKGTLVNGQVKITLVKLKKGKHVLVATYAGSANTAASTLKFTIVQK